MLEADDAGAGPSLLSRLDSDPRLRATRAAIEAFLAAELPRERASLVVLSAGPSGILRGLAMRHRVRVVTPPAHPAGAGSLPAADLVADGRGETLEQWLSRPAPSSGAGLDLDALVALGGPELAADRGLLLRVLAGRRPAPAVIFVEIPAPGAPTTGAERSAAIESLVAAALEAGFRIVRERDLGPEGEGIRLLSLRHDGFRIGGLEPGAAGAILELFERSFHQRRRAEHWRWKYQGNPFGNERISLAFAPSGELVGQYCAYPVPFVRARAGGIERLLAHQVGDTMTARSVRAVGRGPTSILARAARHFYARFCRGRVDFNYGFNTGNIHRFSLRFVGALEVEPVVYWTRQLERQPLSRRRGLLGRRSPYRVEEWREPERDPGLDRLLERVAPSYRCLVERSFEYLAWRYLACPDPGYRVYLVRWRRDDELVGFGVFRERDDTLLWGDALFEPEAVDAVEELLREAVAHAPAVRRIAGWFSHRPAWWRLTLERLAFEPAPEPADLGMVVVPFRLRDARTVLREELYYTMGDGDLF